ncbi:MAG: GtrA family protein [Cytophagia bacterium]|nr:MAG: GtrA family protein [Cytophagales bacterium]TAG02998.1 MAG: GtrA family protein [Cytophagia bacterium]TAG42234.1 MAG: GtrA family protein [Cytophagia bacterium]
MFIQFWNYLERKGLIQFSKFALVGVIGVIFDLSCIRLLQYFGYDDETIIRLNPFTFILSLILNYILSRIFVFTPGRYSPKKEFLLFCVIGTIALFINQGIMKVAFDYFGLPQKVSILNIIYFSKLELSKLIAIVFTVLWTFVAKKFFVFKG